jgi:hypothetical protein
LLLIKITDLGKRVLIFFKKTKPEKQEKTFSHVIKVGALEIFTSSKINKQANKQTNKLVVTFILNQTKYSLTTQKAEAKKVAT